MLGDDTGGSSCKCNVLVHAETTVAYSSEEGILGKTAIPNDLQQVGVTSILCS